MGGLFGDCRAVGLYQLLYCGGSPLCAARFSACPPRLGAACDADSGAGAPNFGTIFASLVTQVAVGDVYSAQRATRGSASVGVCAGGRKPVY